RVTAHEFLFDDLVVPCVAALSAELDGPGRSEIAFIDQTFGEPIVMCDTAAVDAFLEFGSQHVLQVGADLVAVGRSACVELKMHVGTPICRGTRPWTVRAVMLISILRVIISARDGTIIVDLSLTGEQRQLVDSFAALFARESTSERVRAAEPSGVDPRLWKALRETGAVKMAVHEAAG